LSKFGIEETTGTSGGEGQEVSARRKRPQATARSRALRTESGKDGVNG
jgi:hypothetical protein